MKYIDDAPLLNTEADERAEATKTVKFNLDVLLTLEAIDHKLHMWNEVYKLIVQYNVQLPPAQWMYIFDDKDIGPTIDDVETKKTNLLKSLPGPLTRISHNFKPEVYVNGEWVEVGEKTETSNPTIDAFDSAMSVVDTK